MAVLNLPSISRTSATMCKFSLMTNTQVLESPLDGSVQTLEMPGARWKVVFTWRNLTDADARIVKAWLNQLAGMAGRFYCYDFTHSVPAGTVIADAAVNGANQTGRTLNIDGMAAGKTLLIGDYFSVNGELKVVTANMTANGSGQGAVTFEPPLRAAPADNAVVSFNKPVCTMRLIDDQQDNFDFQERDVTNITITGVEVF